jgi:cysteine synthase A
LNALEAEVRIADNPDDYGGYLHSRLQLVRQIVAEMPDAMWINQYDNPKNWQAHSEGTAVEILNDIDEPVDCLVVAVSTTGTIMGLVSTLRAAWPAVRVVGRDRRRHRSTRARTAPTLSGAHPLPRSWRALPEHGLQSRVAAGDGI